MKFGVGVQQKLPICFFQVNQLLNFRGVIQTVCTSCTLRTKNTEGTVGTRAAKAAAQPSQKRQSCAEPVFFLRSKKRPEPGDVCYVTLW